LPGGEKEADKVYEELGKQGIEALYDDRQSSPGEKLADADLLGIPWRVVVSEKTIAVDALETKQRSGKTAELIKQKDGIAFLLKST
jgi:prolyl-tRNA synthetase